MTRFAIFCSVCLFLAACASDAVRGDPVSGAELVAQVEPSCGLCHTLEAADFSAPFAPDLDQLQPGYESVYEAVRNGPGLMPSYRSVLSNREMQDIAAFVSGEAGR